MCAPGRSWFSIGYMSKPRGALTRRILRLRHFLNEFRLLARCAGPRHAWPRRALAQRVEVADKEVRIMGSKSELLRTLVAASRGNSATFGVQSSVLKWRTRRDSNSRPLPSEGSALSS